jgi:uncharacterized iron-regulated membrane protein
MQLGQRQKGVIPSIVMLMVAILLVLWVPGARAENQHQTVPTMPPPTKSPTVTPLNTQTNPPAATPTKPTPPSPTNVQVTNLPPTSTTGAGTSTLAVMTSTATLAVATRSPIATRTSNVIVDNGAALQQTENPAITGGVTSTPVAETSMEGFSQEWLFGLVIAAVVLLLGVGLARWLQRRKKQQDGDDTTGERP